MRYPLAVLLGTLLVALDRGADNIAAVAEFTVWFRLWLPLGETVPTDARWLVHRRESETAMKATLLVLDSKVSRRSGGPPVPTTCWP